MIIFQKSSPGWWRASGGWWAPYPFGSRFINLAVNALPNRFLVGARWFICPAGAAAFPRTGGDYSMVSVKSTLARRDQLAVISAEPLDEVALASLISTARRTLGKRIAEAGDQQVTPELASGELRHLVATFMEKYGTAILQTGAESEKVLAKLIQAVLGSTAASARL